MIYRMSTYIDALIAGLDPDQNTIVGIGSYTRG